MKIMIMMLVKVKRILFRRNLLRKRIINKNRKMLMKIRKLKRLKKENLK